MGRGCRFNVVLRVTAVAAACAVLSGAGCGGSAAGSGQGPPDQAGPGTDTPRTPRTDCWGEASGGDGCAPFPLSDVSDLSDQAGPETDTPSTPSADCWGEASGGDGCAPFPLSDVSDLSDQAGPETDTPPKPYTDCWGEASGGDGCAPFPLPDLSDLSDESGLLDWARYQPEKPDPQCKTDGECLAFDDGDLCNGVPTCLAGKCMFDPGTIVQCVGDGTPCAVKVCLPETGTCAATAAEDGAACSDGNPLTPVDLCVAGKCVGTGITSCTTNGQCNDLYPCTLDLCIAGKCQHSPTPCLGGKPQDCKMAVCTMTGKCVEKQYAGTDLVIFSEDFFDGLAQGWTYPTPAVLGKLEDGPSGKPGLALTLVPGGSVAVASPLLIVPPMSLVVSIGFE
ncbi:MAG: hypothetical protein FJ109_03830, partial [Deltaproteobacteria bacterium]|nr:hypothetical protein [Deltaproteobacteria bacterium]